MLTEKMNAILPLCHRIFFQPFPIFSSNVHITTAENGTIMITFSTHSVVSFCSPFTVSQMPQPLFESLIPCHYGTLPAFASMYWLIRIQVEKHSKKRKQERESKRLIKSS